MIKSAKESTLSTPWLTITSKVETLDNNMQDILAKYNQLLVANTQLIQQLEAMAKKSSFSTPVGTTKPSGDSPVAISPLLDNVKYQSNLLMEQKQKLQGISTELQNVKTQFQRLEKTTK